MAQASSCGVEQRESILVVHAAFLAHLGVRMQRSMHAQGWSKEVLVYFHRTIPLPQIGGTVNTYYYRYLSFTDIALTVPVYDFRCILTPQTPHIPGERDLGFGLGVQT